MAHKHEEEIPAALESVVNHLGDLEVVLGAHARPVVAAVRTLLIAAMAARDRGDMPVALADIGAAMDKLSALADGLDPAEGTLMRALAHWFPTSVCTVYAKSTAVAPRGSDPTSPFGVKM